MLLNNKDFWDWLHTPAHSQDERTSHEYYVHMISRLMGSPDCIARFDEVGEPSEEVRVMDLLERRVPRWYFLELQYCMAAYAKVFGTLFPPLLAHIEQLAYVEWLLYVEPENEEYRDHLVHMFKVAFSGTKLLSIDMLLDNAVESQFASAHFNEWCERQKLRVSHWDDERKKKVLKTALYLAAIFHDFGYGHSYLNRYRAKLSRICPWMLPEADPSHKEHRDTQVVLNSLPSFFIQSHHSQQYNTDEKRSAIVSGFYRDCIALNHSIASTLFLIDLAENLRLRDALSRDLYVAFQIAAEAVMLHDMTKDGNWLHLEKRGNKHFLCCENHHNVPLALILILADELSFWGRAKLHHVLEGNKHVKAVMEKERTSIKVEFTERDNNSSIQIHCTDPAVASNIEKLKCLCSESSAGSDMSILGIKIDICT